MREQAWAAPMHSSKADPKFTSFRYTSARTVSFACEAARDPRTRAPHSQAKIADAQTRLTSRKNLARAAAWAASPKRSWRKPPRQETNTTRATRAAQRSAALPATMRTFFFPMRASRRLSNIYAKNSSPK